MHQSPSESSGIAIELVNCAKSYSGQRVLDSLSLRVNAGETLVLLGPSGCGKSTTLRLIAGLESPDDGGKVLFDGRDVTALPIEQRQVGMVFQSYALFPNMNVRENVEYGLKVRGIAKERRHERATLMMEMVEIDALQSRAIGQLSGGQRQRVALARALAPQPQVLLLDEPLTALDARLRESLRTELNALLRSLKTTAIYVTHDQVEAMALADRITVMDRGRLCQVGTPDEIYYQPRNAFVADFIGSMNRVQRGGREMMFRPEDSRLVPIAEPHEMTGEVVQTQFLGERMLVMLRLDSGATATQNMLVYVSSRQAPAVGTRMGLQVANDGWIDMTQMRSA
jgi:putative spermidine/putrescine transport system ATP-binding protein